MITLRKTQHAQKVISRIIYTKYSISDLHGAITLHTHTPPPRLKPNAPHYTLKICTMFCSACFRCGRAGKVRMCVRTLCQEKHQGIISAEETCLQPVKQKKKKKSATYAPFQTNELCVCTYKKKKQKNSYCCTVLI